MAVAGKTDRAMKPKPVLIELRALGQGIKAAVAIKTGQGTPNFETPPEGAQRSPKLLHEFRQCDHPGLSPVPEERGGRILDRFHGEEGISVRGTLYDNGIK